MPTPTNATKQRAKALEDQVAAQQILLTNQATVLEKMQEEILRLRQPQNVPSRNIAVEDVMDVDSEESGWNRSQTNRAGRMAERDFLAAARRYIDSYDPLDCTLLSTIASFVVEKNRESALVNLLVMTCDTKRMSANNREGRSIWSITTFDGAFGIFTLVEQKVVDARQVNLTIHQLREAAALTFNHAKEIVKMLQEEFSEIGHFTDKEEICGIGLESTNKEGHLLYNVRQINNTRQLVSSFAIKIDDKKAVTETNSSTIAQTTSIAKVAYAESIMAVTEKEHGKFTVMTVVNAASRGSQIGEPLSINERVQNVSINMKHATMQALLSWNLPDIRCCTPCSKEEMKSYADDKSILQGVLPALTTTEVAVGLKLLIILLERLYGLHSRITSRLLSVANMLVDFEMRNEELYPTFKTNGSAVILVNMMLSHFTASMTNKASTVASLESAIDNFDLDINTPWIKLELQLLEKRELLSLISGLKRNRLYDNNVVAITTAQTDKLKKVEVMKNEKKKRKIEISPVINATKTSTIPRAIFGSLCRSNCCLEGCSRVNCKFEHVKDIRMLTASEKEHMKTLIMKHNENKNKPGWSLLTPDPAVVGV
jgi:hypothetical protein